jgi:streptogrisin B
MDNGTVINVKKWIVFSGLLCLLLLTGSVSGEVLSVSGVVVDDKIYTSLAPCYSENLIKSYGPVPVFDKNHRVVSRGIMSDIRGFTERDALYKKLHNLYEATKDPVNKQYSYPNGPVLAYGYDALGSVAVGIYENKTVDQKTMEEIYSIIATESKKQGINDIPVIFYNEPMARLDLGRTDMWRPVIGGVQVGSSLGASTLSFAATRGGQNGFVTAGHIGSVGDTIYQPDLSYPIGTITVSSLGTSSDSAWVQYSNTAGQIFESSNSQPWIYGTANPSVGLGVTMSGITNGVSTGTVIRETSIYNSFFTKVIDNQWYADFSSASGDSGAPVYYKDANQNIQLVGLFWGQGTYSVFSPISSVLSDLS